MCFVRKIEKYAIGHNFANAIILSTIIVVTAFAIVNLKEEGPRLNTIYAFNPVSWSTAIGFSVYAYEGIGLVLPVYEVTAHPEEFKGLLKILMIFTSILYVFFGVICSTAWGDHLDTPLITDQLSRGKGPLWIGWVIKLCFMVNLLFSYPLMLYPPIEIAEEWLFKDWPKSKKRQWSKNLVRTLIVGFITISTVLLKQKLDKFLAVLGALMCTPIAFILPAFFHYQVCAETKI